MYFVDVYNYTSSLAYSNSSALVVDLSFILSSAVAKTT